MSRYFIAILIFVVVTRIIVHYSFIEPLPGGEVEITGVIHQEPSVYDDSQRIVLERYVVYLPLYPTVSYGDTITIRGVSDEGKIKKGKIVSHTVNTSILHSFRTSLLTFYKTHLPADAAALISGVSLGSKALLNKDFWEQLTYTGTAHVVVASGMNIAILSKFILDGLLAFISRRKAIPIAVASIWLYALLIGFDAPIVRATIMGSLTFFIQETGRVGDALRSLFLTVLVMLFVKPMWLTDVSFLLSFFATLSLMLLTKPIENRLLIVPKLIRSDLATSLAATIGTFPILVFVFGRFNLLSPLINTFVLWTIVPITVIGGLAGIVGLVVPGLGTLILFVVYPFVWWFIETIRFFSAL